MSGKQLTATVVPVARVVEEKIVVTADAAAAVVGLLAADGQVVVAVNRAVFVIPRARHVDVALFGDVNAAVTVVQFCGV